MSSSDTVLAYLQYPYDVELYGHMFRKHLGAHTVENENHWLCRSHFVLASGFLQIVMFSLTLLLSKGARYLALKLGLL